MLSERSAGTVPGSRDPGSPPSYEEATATQGKQPAGMPTASGQQYEQLYPSLPQYEPYNPSTSPDAKDTPPPSAPPPPPEYYDRGLENLSYDQVVSWWNALEKDQRLRMQKAGRQLSFEQIQALRKYYKKYIPQEYYPKKILDPRQLSACDYYLMYYLSEELSRELRWYQDNAELLRAFEVLPPSYAEVEREDKAPREPLPPPSTDQADAWWKSLPEAKREELVARGRTYDREKIIIIRREFSPYYRYYSHIRYSDGLDFYDYYLMSRYPTRFYGYGNFIDDYLYYNAVFNLTRASIYVGYQSMRGLAVAASYLGQGLAAGARAFGGFATAIGRNALGGGGGGSSSGNSSDSAKFWLGVAIIVGAIAAACSAVIGGLYAGIKATASLDNLRHGKKVVRSLVRLGAMVGGAYLGAVKGALIGAMVGSLVPGIGTAAGAIIGAIFGAPITAAIAGAIAKQGMRLISYLRTGATSDKWDAKAAQKKLYQDRFSMCTTEIKEMFVKLRRQKSVHTSSWNPFKGALGNSKDKTEKDRYNKFLEGIQSGLDPRKGIRVDAHTRFRWDSQQRNILRENVDLPALKDAAECGLRM